VATLWRWGSRGRRTSLNLKPSSALTSIWEDQLQSLPHTGNEEPLRLWV
jgi:hypothetical protein